MKKKLVENFNKLKDLIETDTQKALLFLKELKEYVLDDITELNSTIEDLRQEVDDLDESNNSFLNDKDELEELQETLPKNLYDELKHEAAQRLYKNLSLEQLENLEQTVKNSFKDNKKNYTLELP